jgi:phosphohistidine phosphatase
MTRQLVVLRHAKSSYPPGVADHDRPLAPRGVADAAAAGAWIRDHVGRPDLVIVSSARRTQETWALASAELAGVSAEVATGWSVRVEPRVYDASTANLLDVLHELPETAGTVLLVGHNPGCEDLVHELARDSDPAAAARLARKYPTSGVAVLELTTEWSSLARRSAHLVEFVVPRG